MAQLRGIVLVIVCCPDPFGKISLVRNVEPRGTDRTFNVSSTRLCNVRVLTSQSPVNMFVLRIISFPILGGLPDSEEPKWSFLMLQATACSSRGKLHSDLQTNKCWL